MDIEEKQLVWMGSSRKDLKTFPEDVKDVIGFALDSAQKGGKSPVAKPLSGKQFSGKGVFEIVDDFDGDTYRAVYTVKLENRIYVLHSFMKKSHNGKKTVKHDIDLILKRYKVAEEVNEKLNAEKQ